MLSYLLVMGLQAGLYIIVAPGVVGLLGLLKARRQRRRGPDIWQPYRDILKLMGRDASIAAPTVWLFAGATLLALLCYGLLGLFLPTIFVRAPAASLTTWHGMGADFLFVIYLLGLARFGLGLAALDAAGSFGPMSTGRQFFVHVLVEPTLLTVVYGLVLLGKTSNLSGLVATYQGMTPLAVLTNPSNIFIFLALAIVLLAEAGRLPFDNPATELELTMIEAGAHQEVGGRWLALLTSADCLKLTFFLSLLASLAWPWGIARQISAPDLAAAVVLYLTKLLVLVVLLAVWETSRGKRALRSLPQLLMMALILALLAVVFEVVKIYFV